MVGRDLLGQFPMARGTGRHLLSLGGRTDRRPEHGR
jgi:hypothetical protein